MSDKHFVWKRSEHMKLHTLALVGALCAFGVSAEAQTCGVLCDEGFWKSASEAEVKAEISKADVNARNEVGWTALMYAAAFGAAESVKALLDAGADVNARNKYGLTSLMGAAGVGTAETVRILLKAGADVNARSELGQSSLMKAAKAGAAETVRILLKAGADASVKDTDGKTAWDHAQDNEKLKGTDAYWMLNDARYK
jgi:uncharacterized protein